MGIVIRRWTRGALLPSTMIFGLMLAACSTHGSLSKSADHAAGAPLTVDGRTAQSQSGEQQRVNGRINPQSSATNGPLVLQQSNGSVVGNPRAQQRVASEGDVTLNYVDTDIREIIRVILGDILKVNYSIDPGFQGMATIRTARPLKHEELLPTLQGLLAQVGGAMTYQNGIFRVGTAGNDAGVPPMVGGANVTAGSQVVPLQFASAKQLATMLEPYVGDAVKLLADPARNVLVVSGAPGDRQSVIDLIKVFDVDYLAGQSYALFPVKSGDPSKVATDLQAALQVDADGPLAGALKVVPVEQANAVMVIAQQQSYLDQAARLISQLDQVKESAGRNLHVYYLKNAQATDVQPLLQRAVNPPSGGGGETAPGNLPPTAEPAQVTASASPATGSTVTPSTGTTGAGYTGAGQMGAGSTQASAPAPLAKSETTDASLSKQVAGANAKGPQIIADSKNNALIIVATEDEYATIEAAVRKLDVMPMQVLIEATVAEVTLNDALQYGTQFFFTHGNTQGTLSNAQSISPTVIDPTATTPLTNNNLFPGLLAPAFPGFAIARAAGSAQYALEALKTVTDVRVISAPKLLILDQEQARLQVGDLVPIITQSATSVISAGAPIVNNVQYQETGVILTVTPRVNSGGLVTLSIDQEVSNVIPTTSSTINSPTFQQRKIESKIVVQDGATISLAGLISDKKQEGSSGIPFLQDIPVLGNLFSTKSNTTDRTELLVLITPHVVYDQGDARALTDELRRRLAPSANLTQ